MHSHCSLQHLLCRWFWRGVCPHPVLRQRNVQSDDDAEDCGEPCRVLENYAHSHAETSVQAPARESDILVSFFVCEICDRRGDGEDDREEKRRLKIKFR